jgi:hypothetical protein
MTMVSEAPRTRATTHDSLSDLLRRFAYAQLPSRFHMVAQLGFPLAYQLWLWGWPRAAGWLTALALFSLWALAEQQLTGRSDEEVCSVSVDPERRTAWRLLRRVSAAAGGLLTVALVLEAFVRIMSGVWKCPGCAG